MICIVETNLERQAPPVPSVVRVIGPFSSLEDAILHLFGNSILAQDCNCLNIPYQINQTWYEFKEMEHPFTEKPA
jgi:hypothetical protein